MNILAWMRSYFKAGTEADPMKDHSMPTVLPYAWNQSVYVPGANQACIPDGTARGTCRRWFGMSDDAQFQLYDDGGRSITGWTHALYYNGRGQVCLPDGTATGTCRKWFRCAMPD